MSDIQKIIIDTDNAIKTCMEQLFFYHQNIKLILPNKTKVLMLCNQYLNDINKAFAKVK